MPKTKNHWFRWQPTWRLEIEYIGFNHDKHNYFSIYWKGTPIFRKRLGAYNE